MERKKDICPKCVRKSYSEYNKWCYLCGYREGVISEEEKERLEKEKLIKELPF